MNKPADDFEMYGEENDFMEEDFDRVGEADILGLVEDDIKQKLSMLRLELSDLNIHFSEETRQWVQ